MTISRLIECLTTISELYPDETEVAIEVPDGNGSTDCYDVKGISIDDNGTVDGNIRIIGEWR